MPTITQRIRSGWNAFIGRDPTKYPGYINEFGYGYGSRPDRVRYMASTQKRIVASVYNKIAVDTSMIHFIHARLDENDNFKESLSVKNCPTSLNDILNVEANIDQTGRAFIQDIVESMFDEGNIAVVPIDTDVDPDDTESYKIECMRVGKITEWFPRKVKVHVYNDITGRYQDLIMNKSEVAIIENPFYSIMNEPNSTAQRLMLAINKLSASNDLSTSKKLDLIIQLPYTTKSPQRRAEARRRKKDIEDQLENSPLGIAYTDATEKVTQLNRSLDNNLWTQVKELTNQLFSELGVTPSILDGTADEATMINYFNSTIAPICQDIIDEFNRKFISKTARSQKQKIIYLRDPFKLVPVSQLADISDKLTRNAVITSNELRAELGFKPVQDDPMADKLLNKNLNLSDEQTKEIYGENSEQTDEEDKTTTNKSKVDGLLKSMGKNSIKGGKDDA